MLDKVEKIRNWPTPTDRTTVKRFLGLASYYWRFIKNFAKIAVPLNRLTSQRIRFRWEGEEQKAFDELKRCRTEAPVLCPPNYEKDWLIEVDASNTAIGAVLSQQQNDGENHPVYYWSRQLNKA